MTNLFNHLKQQHPKQYAESQALRRSATLQPAEANVNITARPKKTTPTQAFEGGAPYEMTSKQWKEVTEAITFYLAKDMVPIKTVENEGFQRLLKVVDPRYELSSRKYFSNTAVPRMYTECRAKIESKVQNVIFFPTTSDADWYAEWTLPDWWCCLPFKTNVNFWTCAKIAHTD